MNASDKKIRKPLVLKENHGKAQAVHSWGQREENERELNFIRIRPLI